MPAFRGFQLEDRNIDIGITADPVRIVLAAVVQSDTDFIHSSDDVVIRHNITFRRHDDSRTESGRGVTFILPITKHAKGVCRDDAGDIHIGRGVNADDGRHDRIGEIRKGGIHFEEDAQVVLVQRDCSQERGGLLFFPTSGRFHAYRSGDGAAF